MKNKQIETFVIFILGMIIAVIISMFQGGMVHEEIHML